MIKDVILYICVCVSQYSDGLSIFSKIFGISVASYREWYTSTDDILEKMLSTAWKVRIQTNSNALKEKKLLMYSNNTDPDSKLLQPRKKRR